MQTLSDISDILFRLRPWLRMIPMVFHYLGPKEQVFKTVWGLVSAHVGRHFRGLPSMLAEMLSEHKYRGQAVTLDWPEPQFGNFYVHHACYCMSRRDDEPMQVKRRWPVPQRGILKTAEKVWAWAAADPVAQPTKPRDPQRDPGRWFTEVVRNSWRAPPKESCRVRGRFVQVAEEIDSAMEACMDYIRELTREAEEYITGDVGVTRDLQRRWKLYAECYSLRSLATAPVTEAAVEAFRQSYALAQPELQHTLKPPVAEWGVLDIPEDPPVEQYRIFAGRVREKWQEEVWEFVDRGRSSLGWVGYEGVLAWPFHRLPPACRAWTQAPWWLLQECTKFAKPFFWSSSKLLRPSGRAVIREICRLAPPESVLRPWWPGAFVVVKVGGVRRLLVVKAGVWQPLDTQIASNIEEDRSFTEGCWIAARHWHRERRRGITTAAAEGWTGALGRLWDPVQGHSSGTMIDRLHLHAGGFKGIGLDEHFIDIVVAALPCKMTFSSRWLSRLGQQGRKTLRDKRLMRSPSSWLHSPAAVECSRTVTLAKLTPSKWLDSARIARKAYDLANLAQADVDLLSRHREKTKPPLQAFPMTYLQRLRYSKLNKQERYAVRLMLRDKMRLRKEEAAAKAPAKAKGKAKAKAKAKAKPKAKGKAVPKTKKGIFDAKVAKVMGKFLASE